MEEEEENTSDIHIFISNLDYYIPKNIGGFLSKQIPGLTLNDEDEAEPSAAEERISEPAGPTPPKKNCFVINGTLSKESADKPSFVTELLDYDRKDEFLESLIKNDVIIYDLCEDPWQLSEALWVARSLEEICERFNRQKKLIVISNLLTWSSTKPMDVEDPTFEESQYRRRKPHPDYQELLNFEKEIIRLGKKHKKRFTTYVLGCGLVYGAGEHLFMHYFRQAWSGQDALPLYFEGQNILPTIHVMDLASVIQNIVDNPPGQRYLVVKDDSFNTLEEIVRAIATELGPGEVINLPTAEMIEGVPKLTLDQLTMNLRIESATIKEEMQVRWTSEMGMVENIELLKKEFIEAHKLKPLRLCVLGPPLVGKTPLAKELCKLYQLHHIHVKAVIYEAYRNLIDPMNALEQLQETRRIRQAAEEAAEAARQRELELEAERAAAAAEEGEQGEPMEQAESPNIPQEPNIDEPPVAEDVEKPTGAEANLTADFEEYKFTSTTDEMPSARRSTFTESVTDLELFPMESAPKWKTEEELEAIVAEVREELGNIRENTDENGRVNDNTLVRLIKNKLLSHPCQNQGFVLDGFPKTMAQADLLFGSEEEETPDGKHFTYNPLITPDHVFILDASNEYVIHRMKQLANAAGVDPGEARVIPPPWPLGFNIRHSTILEQRDSYMDQAADSGFVDDTAESKVGEDETHVAGEEEVKSKEHVDDSETYQQRFDRRLQAYRAAMAPAAALERQRLIAEAEAAAMEEAEVEEERVRLARKQALLDEQKEEKPADEQEGEEPVPEPILDEAEETEPERIPEVLQQAYKEALARRMTEIPALPEQPDDMEENVLTYFDVREIHPLCIDMDKDMSKPTDNGGIREKCMEQIRHRIGRKKPITMPFCSALPPTLADLELASQLAQRFEKSRLRRELSLKNRERKEAEEMLRLLRRKQDDWDDWLQLVRAERQQCAEAQALPMRHYLMRYAMPELTKALLACSEVRPKDPIDFVADFLLNSGI